MYNLLIHPNSITVKVEKTRNAISYNMRAWKLEKEEINDVHIGSESLPGDLLLDLYNMMLKIRLFEEAVAEKYREGKISTPGLLHLYIGEEAVAVGACKNLRNDDYVTSTHRGHGHCIAKGGDINQMMSEIYGKKTGYCKGKGGSMHIAAPEIGIIGCSGIAGAGIPIATGVGLSIQYRKSDQVCVCFFGDGASNTGAFHEGINLAAVWNLPVIFVCENNQYAISVSTEKSLEIKDIADRAAAYGIPGTVVDGMDVTKVYTAVKKTVAKAREGKGPSLIECKTYRFLGHYLGDPKLGADYYRSEDEIKKWKRKDPLQKLKGELLEKGIVAEKGIKKITDAIQKEIAEAVNFAERSPFPSSREALEDIYV
jgi:pyruvate dehydrogenase E1 component alpha subunit